MLCRNQGLAQFLSQFRLRGNIQAMFVANLLPHQRLQQVIDVVAAEMRIAVRRQHLINVALACRDQLEHGNVEGAAAKVVNGHVPALFFVQTVGQRRRRWFVHQAHNVDAGNLAGVLGRLPLCIVKIGRHGDHRALHCFAQERFRPIL